MNLLTLLYLKGNFVDIQPASYHYDAGRICKWTVLDFAPFCLHPEVPRSFVGKSATDDASFAGPRAVAWTTDCTSAFLYVHSITDWKLSAICCRAETHFPKYQILLYCQRSRQYYRIFFKAPVQMALKQSICKSHWYFLNYPQRIHHMLWQSEVINTALWVFWAHVLTLMPLQVLLTHGVFDGHVGEEAFVLLLQLSDLGEQVLSFSPPDVLHQLQLLYSHKKNTHALLYNTLPFVIDHFYCIRA